MSLAIGLNIEVRRSNVWSEVAAASVVAAFVSVSTFGKVRDRLRDLRRIGLCEHDELLDVVIVLDLARRRPVLLLIGYIDRLEDRDLSMRLRRRSLCS